VSVESRLRVLERRPVPATGPKPGAKADDFDFQGFAVAFAEMTADLSDRELAEWALQYEATLAGLERARGWEP